MAIDDTWMGLKLGDIYDFKNGLNADSESYGNGVPFVNVMDVFNRSRFFDNRFHGKVEVAPKQLTENELKYGDILFNRTSETFNEIGLCSVYLSNQLAVFGGFVIRGRPKSNLIDPLFASYFLRTSNVRREIIRRGQGAIRANIGQADLSSVPVIFPSLAHQSKIAEILSTWDKSIEATEKLLENSKKRKKALMQQLLTGKKRLPGFSGEWKTKKLNDIAFCLDNKRKPLNSDERINMQGDIPYYGANGEVDRINKFIFDEPLVLLAEDGGNFDEFQTRPIAQLIEGKSWVNNHAHVLKANESSDIQWLFQSLVHKNILPFINGGTRAKLNKADMLRIPFSFPPKDEQIAISNILMLQDAEVKLLERKASSLVLEKKALMQQLLTGKKRVKVEEAA